MTNKDIMIQSIAARNASIHESYIIQRISNKSKDAQIKELLTIIKGMYMNHMINELHHKDMDAVKYIHESTFNRF